MSIPEGATHKMNGSFYKGLEQSSGDLRLERIKVQVWHGVQWHEVFLNDDAPLVEIKSEPYKPVVGEWCECSFFNDDEWVSVFVIGRGPHDELYILCGQPVYVDEIACSFRPIKTEREQFIDRCFALGLGVSESLEVFGFLYDYGARFKESDDE